MNVLFFAPFSFLLTSFPIDPRRPPGVLRLITGRTSGAFVHAFVVQTARQ